MPRRKGCGSELNGVAAGLPDAELEVLACLWQHGEATARQVRESMLDYRPMAHGSMVTLLQRLLGKGLVSREKAPRGKAFVYRPTRSPSPTYRRILEKLAHRIFGGNRLKVVSTLLDIKPPTDKELDQLQELLDQLRSNTHAEGRRDG